MQTSLPITDAHIPFLAEALDAVQVQRHLMAIWPRFGQRGTVLASRVVRHKPGRRCLIEYDVAIAHPLGDERITLLGKIRAKGTDHTSYSVQHQLWHRGFATDSQDGISVPRPIGVISPWHMVVQCKVPGITATQALTPTGDRSLAEKIAAAAHKLHHAEVMAHRRHTLLDELRILHDRLSRVMGNRPEWTPRLHRILSACDRLGPTIPEPTVCGIHRDFYPDQILVDGARLYLIDLDLYCQSNPALDIGNFIAHLIEYSLRTYLTPDALSVHETAIATAYLRYSAPALQPALHTAIESYTTLTLVRHIYISTQFPERRPFTEALLQLCEQRLAIA